MASSKTHVDSCCDVARQVDCTGYLIHWEEVVPGVLRWVEKPASDPNCHEALAEAGEVVCEHVSVDPKEELRNLTFQALGATAVLVEGLRSAVVEAIASSGLWLLPVVPGQKPPEAGRVYQ